MTTTCNHAELAYSLGVARCPICKQNITRELYLDAPRIDPDMADFTYRVMKEGEL